VELIADLDKRIPEAQCIYGSILCGIDLHFSQYLRSRCRAPNLSLGMEMFCKAAKGGAVCAVSSVFFLISNAHGLSGLSATDVEKGILCLEGLAEAGSALARLDFGELLMGGECQSPRRHWEHPAVDRKRAKSIFESVLASTCSASMSARSTACLWLGRIHKGGLGLEPNPDLAMTYYRLAIG
jgi:TPR repeat protein